LQLLLQATDLLIRKEHLNDKGFREVLEIRQLMVSARKRKYEMTDVL